MVILKSHKTWLINCELFSKKMYIFVQYKRRRGEEFGGYKIQNRESDSSFFQGVGPNEKPLFKH